LRINLHLTVKEASLGKPKFM